MRLTFAVLAHLVPLVPLALGHWPLAAALALAVVGMYGKDRKLDAQFMAISGVGPRADRERAEIQAARRRWRYLMLSRGAAIPVKHHSLEKSL